MGMIDELGKINAHWGITWGNREMIDGDREVGGGEFFHVSEFLQD